jgi:hypothetical protein
MAQQSPIDFDNYLAYSTRNEHPLDLPDLVANNDQTISSTYKTSTENIGPPQSLNEGDDWRNSVSCKYLFNSWLSIDLVFFRHLDGLDNGIVLGSWQS